MPLTDTALRAPKPLDKPQTPSDGNGLFLFISPHDIKGWRVKYHLQGRGKLLTLGTYPQLSLKEAREVCAAAKKQLSGGMDRRAEKKLRAKSFQTTFEAVAREWHTNQAAIWIENYAKDVMEWIAKISSPISAIALLRKSRRQNCFPSCAKLKFAVRLTRPIGYGASAP